MKRNFNIFTSLGITPRLPKKKDDPYIYVTRGSTIKLKLFCLDDYDWTYDDIKQITCIFSSKENRNRMLCYTRYSEEDGDMSEDLQHFIFDADENSFYLELKYYETAIYDDFNFAPDREMAFEVSIGHGNDDVMILPQQLLYVRDSLYGRMISEDDSSGEDM